MTHLRVWFALVPLTVAGLGLGGCDRVLGLGEPRALETEAPPSANGPPLPGSASCDVAAAMTDDRCDAGLAPEAGIEGGDAALGAAGASAEDASTPDASTPDASTPDASTLDASTGGAPPLVLSVCDRTPIAPMGVCSASDAQRIVDSYWMAFGEAGGPLMVEAWCGRAAPPSEHLRDNHRWYLHEMDPRATAGLRADVVGRAFAFVLGRAPTATELASTLAVMEDPAHHWIFFEVAAALGRNAISSGVRCTDVLLERTFQTIVPVCWPARLTCS